MFTNDGIRLEFDGRGRISSLRELDTGRELVREACSFLTIFRNDARREYPVSFRCDGDRLAYSFAGGGEVSFSVKPFDGGWMFTFSGCTHAEVNEIIAGDIKPSCTNYVGALANMMSDDSSGDTCGSAVFSNVPLTVLYFLVTFLLWSKRINSISSPKNPSGSR